ncbi:uncharacterized protein LOC121984596 isoform X2 [Zingiber officinale]|uniref:Myb/SANT-like domain-containing protein n=1 Tax=Zingiber officinale TaxID=94328 RepID=A0A8J5G9H3_ZINOF|nr:uncharacterized protein LOC121984596 isoform X2 [Zingiber officinale]KAG6503595.1 hypothetical protein ZIOFF_035911 [Zingiber officinale]
MVSTLNLDDEDDFGGDAPGSQTSTKRSDGKRKFGDLDEEEEDVFGRKLEKAKKREAAFIVTFAKREQEIADLKSAVRDLKTQLRPPSMQFSMEGKSKKRLAMVATATNAPTSQPVLSTPIEQVESSMPTKVKRKTLCAKHLWTKQEDAALVDCLVELSKDSVWKSENGFRTGYLLHLEKLMAAKVPSSNLKATPHIESRYKLLKRQFHAIKEMLNHSSGFGWNDAEKCIIVTKDVFSDWVKSHPAAIGLRNKEFPHLDDLMFVWGKDCAIGASAKYPTDAVEEINLCDEEADTFEYEIDEQIEDHEDKESVRDEIKKFEILDSSVCPSSKKSTTRKKKGKSDDVLGDLVGEIHKYITTVMEANEEMKGISTYFKKQTECSDRKMRIYDELMELSDFSQEEIMDVGENILKDEYKVDNFFALPKTFRRDYVVKQLSEIKPK